MARFHGRQRGGGKNQSSRGRRGNRSGARGLPRVSQSQAFRSSRLQEPLEQNSDSEDPAAVPGFPDDQDAAGSGAEDDTEEEYDLVKPYRHLLQALNGTEHENQPPLKRRKTLHGESDITLAPKDDQSQSYQNKTESPLAASNLAESDESEDADAEEELDDDQDNDEDPGQDEFCLHFEPASLDETQPLIASLQAANLLSQKAMIDGKWKSLEVYPATRATPATLPFKNITALGQLQLKRRIASHMDKYPPTLSPLNAHLVSTIFRYQDLFFGERTSPMASDLRYFVVLHAVNHVLKTRDRVLKNSARLSKLEATEDLEYRDQGFTRPKVLFIVPTRNSCAKLVKQLLSVYKPEQQENRQRFHDEYEKSDESMSADKPEDFRELFEGNDDDMFRLGIKFTRKSLKFYAQFYTSDIIIASPLGLRMAMGLDDPKKQDYDFLSSVEMVIVDQADALLMQNWEHAESIFSHLNQQPKEAHGCDFSRVRHWSLDGQAQFFRQTIVFSAFSTPELNRLCSAHMLNIWGRKVVRQNCYEGTMMSLRANCKQTFSRYQATHPTEDPDARFKYFSTAVIPAIAKGSKSGSATGQGILLFVPSYMDFVRLRNFLANSSTTQNISFGSISEYTPSPEIARARSHFFSGRHSILLYTGRAHHFRRYRLRGVKRVIFYGLPDNPLFYDEVGSGFLNRSIAAGAVDAGEASVRSLFSKWDILKLERIVGSQRCATILHEKNGDTFNFL